MVLDFSLLSIYCISCTVPLADIGNGDGDWTHEFGAGSHIYRNKIIEQMRWQQRVLFHRQGPKLEFLKRALYPIKWSVATFSLLWAGGGAVLTGGNQWMAVSLSRSIYL